MELPALEGIQDDLQFLEEKFKEETLIARAAGRVHQLIEMWAEIEAAFAASAAKQAEVEALVAGLEARKATYEANLAAVYEETSTKRKAMNIEQETAQAVLNGLYDEQRTVREEIEAARKRLATLGAMGEKQEVDTLMAGLQVPPATATESASPDPTDPVSRAPRVRAPRGT